LKAFLRQELVGNLIQMVGEITGKGCRKVDGRALLGIAMADLTGDTAGKFFHLAHGRFEVRLQQNGDILKTDLPLFRKGLERIEYPVQGEAVAKHPERRSTRRMDNQRLGGGKLRQDSWNGLITDGNNIDIGLSQLGKAVGKRSGKPVSQACRVFDISAPDLNDVVLCLSKCQA